MRRTTLILTILAVATVGIVSWVIFSPDDQLDTQPGDSGVVQTPSEPETDAEAAEAETEAGLADTGEAESSDRTELAAVEEPSTTESEPRTGALVLRVLDPEGQPIEGLNASVTESGRRQFAPWMNNAATPEALAEITSNGNGEIELLGVPAEQDISLVLSGDYWVERSVRVAALREGERRSLGDLSLARGVLLLGRVLGEDNKPVKEAQVLVAERSGNAMPGGLMLAGMDGGTQRRVETDVEGRFRVPGLAPKEYTVTATRVGLVEAETDLPLSLSNPEHRVELRMSDGGWITGVVRAEDGRPIPEAKVALIPARGFASYQWDSERVLRDGQAVGEDGSFRLAGVPDDNSHRVVASAPGFARGRSDRVLPGMKIEIGLAPRVSLTGLVLDASGAPVAEAEVSATPVAAPGSGRPTEMLNMESATTDETGAFEFTELNAGNYNIAVSAPAGETSMENIAVAENNEPLEIRLPEGNAIIVRVTDADGQSLEDARVRIETATTGNEFALPGGASRGVRMTIDSEGNMQAMGGGASRTGRTDPAGMIRFQGMPKGNYRLTVNKDGFARTVQSLERTSDDEQLVVVEAPRAAAVRVLAVDANGLPIEGANLEISRVDADPADTHSAKTDPWGLVVFRDLVPGAYTLRETDSAQRGGLVIFDQEENAEDVPQEEAVRFELEGGEEGEQQIMLAAKAVPTVLVTRLGVPVPNANVTLESNSGEMAYLIGYPGMGGGGSTTNARGLATLPPNDPGTYRLKARANSTNPYTELEVTLGPGAQQLTIELATGGVSGTITGSGGPLVDAQVSLNRERGEGESSGSRSVGIISFAIAGDDDEGEVETFDFSSADARARTDGDGRFRFLDVPPGTYTMSIKAKGHSPLTTEIFVVEEGTQGDRGVIALEAGASLRGKIMNLPNAENGQPFYTLVRLEDADGNHKAYGSVRSSGNYKFDELEPGSYRITVDLPDGESRTSDLINVVAGAPTNFDFPL